MTKRLIRQILEQVKNPKLDFVITLAANEKQLGHWQFYPKGIHANFMGIPSYSRFMALVFDCKKTAIGCIAV